MVCFFFWRFFGGVIGFCVNNLLVQWGFLYCDPVRKRFLYKKQEIYLLFCFFKSTSVLIPGFLSAMPVGKFIFSEKQVADDGLAETENVSN